MPIPRRKNIRLPKQIYSNKNLIFSVTICTKDRKPIFRDLNWSRKVLKTLKTEIFVEHVECFAYCLMPDHLHLLIAPKSGNIVDFIARWKSYTANILKKDNLKSGCWQRSFYDHAFRREEDIEIAAQYIVNNPVRKKMVKNWQEYPFSWHKWM